MYKLLLLFSALITAKATYLGYANPEYSASNYGNSLTIGSNQRMQDNQSGFGRRGTPFEQVGQNQGMQNQGNRNQVGQGDQSQGRQNQGFATIFESRTITGQSGSQVISRNVGQNQEVLSTQSREHPANSGAISNIFRQQYISSVPAIVTIPRYSYYYYGQGGNGSIQNNQGNQASGNGVGENGNIAGYNSYTYNLTSGNTRGRGVSSSI